MPTTSYRVKTKIMRQLDEAAQPPKFRNLETQEQVTAIKNAIMDDEKITLERKSQIYKAVNEYSFFLATVLSEWVNWTGKI